ncbi:MAG: hypothetical protein HC938_14135, partial [Nitrospira sp.]|nr:hypothetical protein [Nitrospira sp.]
MRSKPRLRMVSDVLAMRHALTSDAERAADVAQDFRPRDRRAPQDRVLLEDMQRVYREALTAPKDKRGYALEGAQLEAKGTVTDHKGWNGTIQHGDVVIASITSCTNTSNPSVMLGAGILAKKAVEKGLTVKPWVKTSLAPGSKVVTEYLEDAGLTPYLDQLGFQTVGYGCTTCIGNSGPLDEPIVNAINEGDLVAASVLSGNRNFEGRVNPYVRANYLASPPLVVAYALAGTVDTNLETDPIGTDKDGNAVYLRDIWPTTEDIAAHLDNATSPETFRKIYDGIESIHSQRIRARHHDECRVALCIDSSFDAIAHFCNRDDRLVRSMSAPLLRHLIFDVD